MSGTLAGGMRDIMRMKMIQDRAKREEARFAKQDERFEKSDAMDAKRLELEERRTTASIDENEFQRKLNTPGIGFELLEKSDLLPEQKAEVAKFLNVVDPKTGVKIGSMPTTLSSMGRDYQSFMKMSQDQAYQDKMLDMRDQELTGTQEFHNKQLALDADKVDAYKKSLDNKSFDFKGANLNKAAFVEAAKELENKRPGPNMPVQDESGMDMTPAQERDWIKNKARENFALWTGSGMDSGADGYQEPQTDEQPGDKKTPPSKGPNLAVKMGQTKGGAKAERMIKKGMSPFFDVAEGVNYDRKKFAPTAEIGKLKKKRDSVAVKIKNLGSAAPAYKKTPEYQKKAAELVSEMMKIESELSEMEE